MGPGSGAKQAERRLELAGHMAETEKAVIVALTKAQQSEERAKQMPRSNSAEAMASLGEWKDAAASIAEAEVASQLVPQRMYCGIAWRT